MTKQSNTGKKSANHTEGAKRLIALAEIMGAVFGAKEIEDTNSGTSIQKKTKNKDEKEPFIVRYERAQ